jgi:hypothetical protein
MTSEQIKEMQQRIGVTPDGFWGPKSIEACKKHLKKFMPKSNLWPKSDQASLKRFYGDPSRGEVEGMLVAIDVSKYGLLYGGNPVKTMRIHKKCADSMLRALALIAALPDSDGRWVLKEYAGVYNHRPMRGGSSWSLHAYGAAIDLAPDSNGNHTHWPTKATMTLDVMECFASEGWLSAGAFWGRDGMHHEATQ